MDWDRAEDVEAEVGEAGAVGEVEVEDAVDVAEDMVVRNLQPKTRAARSPAKTSPEPIRTSTSSSKILTDKTTAITKISSATTSGPKVFRSNCLWITFRAIRLLPLPGFVPGFR